MEFQPNVSQTEDEKELRRKENDKWLIKNAILKAAANSGSDNPERLANRLVAAFNQLNRACRAREPEPREPDRLPNRSLNVQPNK